MRLDGAKVLVTGGCGLIGSATIDLILRNHRVERIVILDNLVRGAMFNVQEALKNPRVTLVRGDIRDAGTVQKTVSRSNFRHRKTIIRTTIKRCTERVR